VDGDGLRTLKNKTSLKNVIELNKLDP